MFLVVSLPPPIVRSGRCGKGSPPPPPFPHLPPDDPKRVRRVVVRRNPAPLSPPRCVSHPPPGPPALIPPHPPARACSPHEKALRSFPVTYVVKKTGDDVVGYVTRVVYKDEDDEEVDSVIDGGEKGDGTRRTTMEERRSEEVAAVASRTTMTKTTSIEDGTG